MNETMTRRQLIQYGGLLALAAAGSAIQGCSGGGGATTGPNPSTPTVETFVQYPVRSSLNGVLDTDLHIRMATNQVNGMTINTRTYEGMIGAPTLRIAPGETLLFNIVNDLPANPDEDDDYPDHNTPHHFNTTNNHTHGFHVSPSGNSDNIFVEVPPGTEFQYEYNLPANHPAGTYWYHPHKHGSSAVQMLGGMAGALIIQGDLDEVPEVAAARELVFVINELNIDPETGMVPEFVPPQPNPFEDEFPLETRILLVNGQTNPTIVARPGEVVRFRVVCATVITFCPLVLDDHTLHVLAWDGVTLSQVEPYTGPVSVGPGNRVEFLVRAGAAGTYLLRKLANFITFADDPEVIMATLEVQGEPVDMALPTVLPAPFTDIGSGEITGARTLTFQIGLNGPLGPPDEPLPTYLNFSVDNQRFDPERVDHTVNLGAVEEWTLINQSPSGHPFHIHINPFQVLSLNDVPFPKPEWRDTIMIPAFGKVVIRHRFEDFRGLFVLHCHILVHEDLGMMQTVNVI